MLLLLLYWRIDFRRWVIVECYCQYDIVNMNWLNGNMLSRGCFKLFVLNAPLNDIFNVNDERFA